MSENLRNLDNRLRKFRADVEELAAGLGKRHGALRTRIEDLEAEVKGLREEVNTLWQAISPRLIAGGREDAA